ncbi:hypothetical protein XENOCAPTIV_026200 [Xenoophorus captivus]|uniref:PNPLA domain-containing protein n=1 Tax=Xenoophorus captivus TaxID=1517983 RepID=A0ABV0S3J0_9TELE
MFDLSEEWNISFAGCGFRSIYYVGALSCILERVPQLVQGASKFGGASSGCLVAAALAVGIPIGCFIRYGTLCWKSFRRTPTSWPRVGSMCPSPDCQMEEMC